MTNESTSSLLPSIGRAFRLVLPAALAVACSSDTSRDGASGDLSGVRLGDGGHTRGGGEVCEPVGDGCGVGVIDGPRESGAECLAMRDNAGADRVQLRQTWTRITRPVGNTIDIVYGVLQLRGELPLSDCNMRGVSGYVKLVDWDRSNPDITQQTARIGWANFAGNGAEAVRDGLCMVELDYVDPPNGLDTPWRVRPVEQRRVAEDFTVEEVRGTIEEGSGIFYYDEATGVSHHYSPLEHIVIFENPDKVVAIPIHDAEMRIRFNDEDTLNCAGEYRADAMDPRDDCFSARQDNPPWGCTGGACPAGEGPVVSEGWFLITELENVFTTVLQSTLCVSYPGQQRSIDEGWADPDGWGLNCSGSPKWNPDDPIGGLPDGDWCSATNTPATADCHDAWRSHAFGTMAGFNVQPSTCTTDAQAPGRPQR